MKKALHGMLFLSFILTIMAPISGIYVHKLAGTVFFLLSIIHMIMYRRKIRGKQGLLAVLILFSYSFSLPYKSPSFVLYCVGNTILDLP